MEELELGYNNIINIKEGIKENIIKRINNNDFQVIEAIELLKRFEKLESEFYELKNELEEYCNKW